MVAEKTCTRCGETKPVAEFHRNRTRRDGLQSRCKVCQRAAVSSDENTARSRARGRAIQRLIEAHRSEYERLYRQELAAGGDT